MMFDVSCKYSHTIRFCIIVQPGAKDLNLRILELYGSYCIIATYGEP